MFTKRNIISSLILLSVMPLFTHVYGQAGGNSGTAFPEGTRPDIPGELGFEFGLSLAPDFPDEMKLKLIGSNLFTGYYKYDINVGDSKFSIHPGVGVSVSKFSFNKNVTLTSQQAGEDFETILIGLDSVSPGTSFNKSLLKAAYLEIPLEFTFRTNREIPDNGFRFTLGAKAGYLIDSKTKVKFEEGGQKKITKQKERYDLNRIRVILTAKVGYGKFGFFYNYSLLPLFENDRGPQKTTAAPMSIGVYLDLF